jgi:hypothetical protein
VSVILSNAKDSYPLCGIKARISRLYWVTNDVLEWKISSWDNSNVNSVRVHGLSEGFDSYSSIYFGVLI